MLRRIQKKTVRNCDTINIMINLNLYYIRGNASKRKLDGGLISATLRLGIGLHSKMIYDWRISKAIKQSNGCSK